MCTSPRFFGGFRHVSGISETHKFGACFIYRLTRFLGRIHRIDNRVISENHVNPVNFVENFLDESKRKM